MELEEGMDPTASQTAVVTPSDTEPPRPVSMATAGVTPQACGAGCASAPIPNGNGMAAPSYVYVLGRVDPRFPSLAVEKEFAQAARGGATTGLTDRGVLATTLSEPANRYLARQLCWVLTVAEMETYLLHPRDPADLDRLVEAIRPAPSPTDIDVVIGMRGPIAPPEMCNGLMVPMVVFDQISRSTGTR